jgi:hypothetical protein
MSDFIPWVPGTAAIALGIAGYLFARRIRAKADSAAKKREAAEPSFRF